MFDGWCAARNIDPLTLPVRRCVNVAWHALTEWADEKATDELERQIEQHESRLSAMRIAETGVPLWWDEGDVDRDAQAFAAAFR